ncbi:MAG: tetratricopeptide repeat protein [Planctomycetaceae bacterium]
MELGDNTPHAHSTSEPLAIRRRVLGQEHPDSIGSMRQPGQRVEIAKEPDSRPNVV